MIGLCHNIVDQIDSALAILKEVEEELLERGPQAHWALGDLSRDVASIYLAAYRAALRGLGDVRLQEGKPDEAFTLLEQSLHRVPSAQALLYTQGYIAFCRLWLSLGKIGEALRCADEARRYCREYGFKHQRLTLDRLLAQHHLAI